MSRAIDAGGDALVADATLADVVVLGGGLSGLSLAIQLRQRNPDLDVRVLERRAHPVGEGAHKVGESLVEIGAHYFAKVLGFRDHLDAAQIRKFGFRFFFSDRQPALDACTELGVSQLLPTPSWQLDRGRFENFLGEQARALGVRFDDQAVVRGVDLGEADAAHTITFERDGQAQVVHARWVVDASGRAGVLKRKLDLAEPNAHDANAVWWRVQGHIDPNDAVADPDWLQRCTPPDRWRSTNHLCGPGYWAWMIPLASGAHSIGIVADPRLHPLDTLNTHAKAMDWMREHQPAIAALLDRPGHALHDFQFLRHFSHGCKQVFSPARWALTGDAGLFLDPFYSPGSDFIAIANTYICDLVERDRAGQSIRSRASLYAQLYASFYGNTLTLYQDQYPIFGDAQVMPLKVMWDYVFYWALLAPVFFADRLTDVPMFGRLQDAFERARALNLAMQALLREWQQRNGAPRPPDQRFLDQFTLDWFLEMNGALDDVLDDDAFATRVQANVARMQWLAGELLAHARSAHPGIDDHGLGGLLASGASTQGAEPLPAQWYAETA